MVDLKEISNIKIVPYTLMSATILAILIFIIGIIIAITLGLVVAFLPSPLGGAIAGLGVAAIIAFPILTFLISLSIGFLTIILYNWLVPRVGGVKLTMDGNNLTEIPIIPFTLILSIIRAIWAFIFGVIIATSIAPLTGVIGTSIPLIANATNTSFTGAMFGVATAYLYVFLIIGLPILAFISGFILYALFAIFYNYIAIRVTKIQLNFTAISGAWNDLSTIPIVPASLALAVVSAIFGLIYGILSIGRLGVGGLIADIILGFIVTFIVVAIATALYNWLAPRIGAIKLELT